MIKYSDIQDKKIIDEMLKGRADIGVAKTPQVRHPVRHLRYEQLRGGIRGGNDLIAESERRRRI